MPGILAAMATSKSKNRGEWTPERKAAISRGRSEHAAVSAYLESLSVSAPRGPRRTPERLAEQLQKLEASMSSLSAAERLLAHQRCFDLRAALEQAQRSSDVSSLEDAFVAVAASYGARHGVSYQAWRAVGVSPATLKRAGIPRSS